MGACSSRGGLSLGSDGRSPPDQRWDESPVLLTQRSYESVVLLNRKWEDSSRMSHCPPAYSQGAYNGALLRRLQHQ